MEPIPLDIHTYLSWRQFHETQGGQSKLSARPEPISAAAVVTLLSDLSAERRPLESLSQYDPAVGARHSFGVLVRGVSLRWLGVTAKSTGQITFIDETHKGSTEWGGEYPISPNYGDEPEAVEVCADIHKVGLAGRPDTVSGKLELLSLGLDRLSIGEYTFTLPATAEQQ